MAIAAFKVIQGHQGRYQSKTWMRFRISDYRFGVIAASLLFKFWTLCVFEPPFGVA